MVNSINIHNQNINRYNAVSFGKKEKKEKIKKDIQDGDKPLLMYQAKKRHPITTAIKVNGSQLKNAFTTYPQKGLQGSKNSNFYEFLSMGKVANLLGSVTMIALFNAANDSYKIPDKACAEIKGKQMGLGVIFYGLAKALSRKLIETPVNLKYGIDVNVPYKKKITELPEKGNKDNLIAHEYHKAYESVDFPYWDLFYDNKSFGDKRNSYYQKIGKKMGIKDNDLEHADQKVKPLIRKKIVKTKLYSTLTSYLWAAVGVGIASQKPLGELPIGKARKKGYSDVLQNGVAKNKRFFAVDFGKRFVKSCKEFVNNERKPNRIGARVLLGTAIAATLIGNLATLLDFNKSKGANASAVSPLIDESKEKVVC